jgi:dTMP kinase
MKRGKFITLEGGEGAGKSTQVKLLADFLCGKGIEVVQTREPGGSPSAEAIRELWLTKDAGYWDTFTELLLVMAARREHLVKTIIPALDRGAWVISDRFVDSTRAYQGICQELGLEAVEEIYRRVAPDFEPDLTLLLDLPAEEGIARMAKRSSPDNRYDQNNIEFHHKLRVAYLFLAEKYMPRFRTINASAAVPAVAAAIERAVRGYFKL